MRSFYLGPDNVVKNNVAMKTINGVVVWGDGNLQYQYNDVWESENAYSRYPPDSAFTPDSTNLLVDPMILNDDTTRGELDFHLQKYSPLIDAGDPAFLIKMEVEVILGCLVDLLVKAINILILPQECQ